MSDKDLKKSLFKFFGSLRQYPNGYLPLIFEHYIKTTKHLAYLCPLCLKNAFYTENTTRHFTDGFSLDHYPPQNVGGTKKIMICKKCNNTAGHSYENSLIDRVRQEAFNRKIPNIEIPAKSNIENVKGWLHASVSITDDGSTILKLPDKVMNRIPPFTGRQKGKNDNRGGLK